MVMGVDEAGRGPVLGPLVVASVFCIDPGSLKTMGAKDSKMLSASRREEVLSRSIGKISTGIVVIPAGSVDEARESMTMNRLEVLAFASSLATLIEGGPVVHSGLPEGIKASFKGPSRGEGWIMLDAADVDEERFGKGVGNELALLIGSKVPQIISKHKADRDDPVVAMASIVAKVTRDREIERIRSDIGKDIGSGYPSDPVTRRFLSEWVKKNKALPPECRRSWETARKILSENLQPTLFSFD